MYFMITMGYWHSRFQPCRPCCYCPALTWTWALFQMLPSWSLEYFVWDSSQQQKLACLAEKLPTMGQLNMKSKYTYHFGLTTCSRNQINHLVESEYYYYISRHRKLATVASWGDSPVWPHGTLWTVEHCKDRISIPVEQDSMMNIQRWYIHTVSLKRDKKNTSGM